MKRLLLALAAALVAACAGAKPARVKPTKPDVLAIAEERTYRLEVTDCPGNGFGSAVDIGRGMALTAAHMVDDPSCKYTLYTRDGDKVGQAKIGLVRSDVDRALLYVPTELPSVCERRPALEERVIAVGWARGAYHVTRGKVISDLHPDDGWRTFDAPIRPGSSGSGVWGLDGCLVGVTVALWRDGFGSLLVEPF